MMEPLSLDDPIVPSGLNPLGFTPNPMWPVVPEIEHDFQIQLFMDYVSQQAPDEVYDQRNDEGCSLAAYARYCGYKEPHLVIMETTGESYMKCKGFFLFNKKFHLPRWTYRFQYLAFANPTGRHVTVTRLLELLKEIQNDAHYR